MEDESKELLFVRYINHQPSTINHFLKGI